MKQLVTICALVAALVMPAMASPVVVDSFDFGLVSSPDYQTNPSFFPLSGSANDRAIYPYGTTQVSVAGGVAVADMGSDGEITFGYGTLAEGVDFTEFTGFQIDGIATHTGYTTSTRQMLVTVNSDSGWASCTIAYDGGSSLDNLFLNFDNFSYFNCNPLTGEDQPIDQFVLNHVTSFSIGLFSHVEGTEPANFTYTLDQITLVPEPATMALLGLGGLFLSRRKK